MSEQIRSTPRMARKPVVTRLDQAQHVLARLVQGQGATLAGSTSIIINKEITNESTLKRDD